MVIGAIMSCYPVPMMIRAIKTQNARLLGSVWMNFAMFAMCLVWVIHAIFVRFDSHVLIANVFGVIAQLVSLWIHLLLREKEPLQPSEINLNDGTWSSWFLVRVEGFRRPPMIPGSSYPDMQGLDREFAADSDCSLPSSLVIPSNSHISQ
jgi:hypothetical protein